MQSQQKAALSLSAFLTQSKAKGEEIRKGWIEQKNKAKVEHKNQAKKNKIKGLCSVLVHSIQPEHRWIQGHLCNMLRAVSVNMCPCFMPPVHRSDSCLSCFESGLFLHFSRCFCNNRVSVSKGQLDI